MSLPPGGFALRSRVAASLLTPKAAWGAMAGGRRPTKREEAEFARAFRLATRRFGKPRSCPSLRKALYEVPQGDLALSLACCSFSAIR
eukprot:518432-Alexandrium_andersonii.AAC.1